MYCVELWGYSNDTILRPLFLLQKKIIRIIFFSPFLAHTRPIFLKLNLLPLCKVLYKEQAYLCTK